MVGFNPNLFEDLQKWITQENEAIRASDEPYFNLEKSYNITMSRNCELNLQNSILKEQLDALAKQNQQEIKMMINAFGSTLGDYSNNVDVATKSFISVLNTVHTVQHKPTFQQVIPFNKIIVILVAILSINLLAVLIILFR